MTNKVKEKREFERQGEIVTGIIRISAGIQ